MQMQQTAKHQWKALYSAFRAARVELRYEREDGWTVFPHSDVAAVHAAATAVADDRVRAGFALRHAGKLGAVLRGAEDAKCAWRYVPPGAARTLPPYERGMFVRSRNLPYVRLRAQGYSPRWEPRYVPRPPVPDLPEEVLPEVLVEGAA
jgi:hypothetical protein